MESEDCPHFFGGPINQHASLDALQYWSVPQLANLAIEEDPWSNRTGNRHITLPLLGNTVV